MQLAASVGEAKPRSTPSHVISSMETAQYKDWATADSDKRCPICLDDVCVFSRYLTLSSLRCERFCSTHPLILCSNSLIVLIGFTGIVFRWVFCSRYLAKNLLTGVCTLQQWLGGASTCPVCRKPVHGPSSPRQSGLPPPPIQDIQNYWPFGTTYRRGPPPPGPGPGSNGHADASGAWPRR